MTGDMELVLSLRRAMQFYVSTKDEGIYGRTLANRI